MKTLGEWNLVWARKMVLKTDFDMMRIVATQNDSICSYYGQNRSNFVPFSTYILVGVLDISGLFSEVNAIFHFFVYSTLKNMLH